MRSGVSDPLAGHAQDAFWKEILTHDWVLHSARQDIEVIYQAAGAMPTSIFDTQVAAGLLGYPAQMGYAGLVKELFDVEIHKSHTRADWSKRPLRDEYLEYAAEDVEYLLPACQILTERLEEHGRLAWAREDSQWLLDPTLYDIGESQAIERLKGARAFRGRKRAAAVKLAAWREAEAIKRDRPRQWIMRDNVLLDIAWNLPTTEAAMADIQGVPPKLVQRVGRQLLGLIAAAGKDDGGYDPPRPPDARQKALLKEMQSARGRVCDRARYRGGNGGFKARIVGRGCFRPPQLACIQWLARRAHRRRTRESARERLSRGQSAWREGSGARCVLERGGQALIDLVDGAFGIDRRQLVSLAVELDQRLRAFAVDVQAIADRLFVVVLALNQFAARVRAFVQSLPVRKSRRSAACLSASRYGDRSGAS